MAEATDFEAPNPTFPSGAHVAVVEVDPDTGATELLRLVAVDDAGTIHNPLLFDGQVHGGIAQGVAQALLEEITYDDDGNLLTSNFMDYPVISSAELPSFDMVRDTPAVAEIGLPVYHRSSHAATLGRLHTPLAEQLPIVCAGVTVFPGDVIVGDDEGAIVIPALLAEEVAADAHTQEIEEEWAIERVAAGESSIGTFPIADDRRAEFEEWRAAREG